ncbi:PilW family protein [Cystobacter fuscus]|uniref:PilW family protein n=1 Tax=Cystobacter fuscus TaxID=43 RepID=UPI002B2870D6|nr:prepilin-type N-terminal cleavage/methylation domain-containing protein [Cystobacter fuscus]
MKRRASSPALRGFTLLELVVASSLSLIVLAAALWSAAELQRRGTFEESLMEAQNTLRAVREMLVVELQRAGMGVGSARMVFGRQGAAADDVRYAINVSPEERFDGTGAFPADPTFAPPTGSYADRISDVLQVWSWDSEAMNGTNPIGMVPLTLCTHAANASDLYRSGNELCASTVPVGLRDRLVMVVKPETRIACVMRVTAVNQDASAPYARIVVSPGITEGLASNNNPCKSLAAGQRPNDGTQDYWGADRSGGFILLMRGSAFRVNWKTGTPVLERRDISSVVNPAPAAQWVTLSHDVEMIRLRLGVMEDLKLPKSPVLWFPNAAPLRPHLEQCTGTACDLLVPGGWTADPSNPSNAPTARDALMSRVRMVQVQVITRTARLDSSLIRKDASGEYLRDADNHPQDGYKRRSSTLEIMPRNFALAGVLQ